MDCRCGADNTAIPYNYAPEVPIDLSANERQPEDNSMNVLCGVLIVVFILGTIAYLVKTSYAKTGCSDSSYTFSLPSSDSGLGTELMGSDSSSSPSLSLSSLPSSFGYSMM